MGFTEYDRIRSKNSIYNEAYEEFKFQKKMGIPNKIIANVYENQKKFMLAKNDMDNIRLKIIDAVISLAKKCDENFRY
jgi:hypothetical protein